MNISDISASFQTSITQSANIIVYMIFGRANFCCNQMSDIFGKNFAYFSSHHFNFTKINFFLNIFCLFTLNFFSMLEQQIFRSSIDEEYIGIIDLEFLPHEKFTSIFAASRDKSQEAYIDTFYLLKNNNCNNLIEPMINKLLCDQEINVEVFNIQTFNYLDLITCITALT
ncbi:hypothetical protein BpHYR1_046770 [Brachionus plicatilis]|uniref:Uncharacterized protein n=1 Tax=Brachionus plicatilis TaxID=10195 RepID=A0A3M7Q151_BRAPC|nr:hypothetical protein BpHYR1_046770 [Brachionus plicatilis]